MPDSRPPPPAPPQGRPWTERALEQGTATVRRFAPHWPLLPILALALVLRLVRLFPAFAYGDEAEYVIVARSLAHDPSDLQYPALEGFGPRPFVSQPPLVLYLFALGIQTMGLTHGPLMVSVLLGTATVALVYVLGVRLRGRGLGLAAALILAVLPYHVGVSRSTLLEAGLTFFVTLAIVALLHWLDRPSLGRALLLGAAAAAACLSKLTGILVLVPVAVVLLAHQAATRSLWRRRRDEPTYRSWRMAKASIGVAAVPILAAAAWYVGLLWRLGASNDLAAKLGWQADRVAGVPAAGQARPWHWYFTVHEVGLLGQLGVVVSLLAVVGLVAVALRIAKAAPTERSARLALLVWPLTILLFFMASGVKQWFYLMPAIPAVAVLAAWPLQPAARRLGRWVADGKPTARHAVTAWLAVFLVVATAMPVHATWTERIQGQGRFGDGVPEAARWIDANDPGAGSVGTTLARFTLYLETGGPVYHYYVNHTAVDDAIAAGTVRYAVIDTDLLLDYEQEWLRALVEAHDGVEVLNIPTTGGAPVQVYRLAEV